MKNKKITKKLNNQNNLTKKIKVKTYIVHIRGTLNNMIFSLTDLQGKTLYNTSCGSWNYSGSRKASTFATRDTGNHFKEKLKNFHVKNIHIVIAGIRRFAAKKAVGALCKAFEVLSIHYPNQLPHNGCRKKKKQRK